MEFLNKIQWYKVCYLNNKLIILYFSVIPQRPYPTLQSLTLHSSTSHLINLPNAVRITHNLHEPTSSCCSLQPPASSSGWCWTPTLNATVFFTVTTAADRSRPTVFLESRHRLRDCKVHGGTHLAVGNVSVSGGRRGSWSLETTTTVILQSSTYRGNYCLEEHSLDLQ